MKKIIFLSLAVLLGLSLSTGCAPMRHTWPDLERSIEDRISATQAKVGDGLQRNVLSIDQTQSFLAALEGIRYDYQDLRGRTVYRRDWDNLNHRLDELNREIDRALERPVTRDVGGYPGDRIIFLQRSIADGRDSGRLTDWQAREFQGRLDSIRRDYIRFTEGGRVLNSDQRMDISRRLDSLEADVSRAR
jgi:hypothetical protein